MSAAFGYILCGLVGLALPFQAATSASLGKRTGFPSFAALISFLVGLALIIGYLLIETRGTTLIDTRRFSRIPWWVWIGGLSGAAYVITISIFTQYLGATVLLSIVVITQLLGAALYDHWAWFDLPSRPLTWLKGSGLFLALVGVILIAIDGARK